MRKSLKHDIIRRALFKKTELSVLLHKVTLKYCNHLKSDLCLAIAKSVLTTCGTGLRSKIHTCCFVSGRSKGLVTKFKVSRIVFREFSWGGLFVGVCKSGW